MDEILPDVYRVSPTKVTPTKYISLFVKRDQGNLLFPCFGAHSSIDSSFDAIESMGGISAQLLGDMHFAARYNDDVFDRFSVPLMCSDVEAPSVTRKVRNVVEFPFEHHEVLPGVEAIPTPGHRPGAVSYLMTHGGKRLLFAGDTIWHDGERWSCFVNKKNVRQMVSTLEMLANIRFDVLLANVGVDNPVCHVELDADERSRFLNDIASKL